MDVQRALELIDRLVQNQQGHSLTDLQRGIVRGVWQGQRYGQIARATRYSEGHLKDVSSDLWQILSQALGQRVNKSTLRSVLERIPAPPPQEDADPALIGRSEALSVLDRQRHRQAKGILIWGEGGLGKTSLAQHYLRSGRFDQVLEVLMAKDTATITPVESLVVEWLQQDLGEEPSADLGICLSRLKRHLQQARIGILIDNVEPALDRRGRFLATCRNYRELLRTLWDPSVQSFTLITSRDRLCEPGLTIDHYRLPGLGLLEWQQYFQHQGIRFRPEILHQIHTMARGNTKAMGILGGAVRDDFEADLDRYWQTLGDDPLATPDLKNLVSEQFDRLQDLDPAAYRLLCRMGCFRYQEIPTLSPDLIARLLWDHPETHPHQAIGSLKQRSLLEVSGGTCSLHPMIRAEAVHRLRQTPDWQDSHRQAATYWTDTIASISNLSDALQAFEAYYHHLALQDFTAAAQVILKARHNQWGQYLSLGGTLYRLGLSQQVLAAIREILDWGEPGDHLSELYDLLADQYWISGQLHQAVSEQTHALHLSQHQLEQISDDATPLSEEIRQKRYYFQMLSLDSRLSLGLYGIDLWDLAPARDWFAQVIDAIDRFQDPRHHHWGEKASIGLALVEAITGDLRSARQRLDPILQQLETSPAHHTGRLAYFLQLMGQTYIHLEEWQQAEALFRQTLQIAETGHYLQLKGRALTGLAICQRSQGSFEAALICHREAIPLLHQIGALCDLAAAYVQQGVTLDQMHTPDPASWEQALQLYQSMNAPLQIERIRQLRQRGGQPEFFPIHT